MIAHKQNQSDILLFTHIFLGIKFEFSCSLFIAKFKICIGFIYDIFRLATFLIVV